MRSGDKNIHMHALAIDELEPEFAVMHRMERGDTEFLLRFAHGTFKRCFARIDLASWAH
jgi:hypothetical protein